MTTPWKTFPPTRADEKRIENYGELTHAVRKKDPPEGWDTLLPWVPINFCSIICSLSADLLFGESPAFRGNESLEEIVSRNGFNVLCSEIAFSGAFRGDVVLKVRYDNGAIIEAVDPSLFFPQFSPDNLREMKQGTLAWIKSRKNGGERYLRKEIHEPGRIMHELWRLEGNQITDQVPLNTFEEYHDLAEIEETGYEGLLVEHIPNWRIDTEFWGISDICDLLGLQKELSNRISRIGDTLDKHSVPKLILPPGIMQFDERLQRWYVEKETLEALEIDPEMGGNLPRYLVWDAQLQAAFSEIDKLLELMMMVSETSPAAIGLEKNGVAESGRALKYRMVRTLAKMQRKKRYFDHGLKNVLFAAQALEHIFGGGPRPEEVQIDWQDGLPNDDQELIEQAVTGFSAGLMSRRRGVELQGVEDVDAELKEIERDEREETEAQYRAAPETLRDSGEGH